MAKLLPAKKPRSSIHPRLNVATNPHHHLAPCARTAWHRQAVGQALHVTEGVGLVQARGGKAIEIRAGDTIHTPPGEWHWHGAAPDHFMTHLAMWEGPGEEETPETEWGDLVTDEDYNGR